MSNQELPFDLTKAEEQTPAAIEKEIGTDEYLKDGVIYCKVCNTPREVTRDMGNGKVKTYRCKCKCQLEEINKVEAENTMRERIAQIERMKDLSLISNRYREVCFEHTNLEGEDETFLTAFNRCKKYCEVADKVLAKGMGIYLYGDKGTGKTHLTCCMANELMLHGKQALFTNLTRIAKSIKDGYRSREGKDNFIAKIANVDFLFIDDLGTEKIITDTDDTWLQEKMFEVVNERYNAKKPTIFTSNYSIKELITERGVSDRTADRISEMSTVIMKIEGGSHRKRTRIKEDIPF